MLYDLFWYFENSFDEFEKLEYDLDILCKLVTYWIKFLNSSWKSNFFSFTKHGTCKHNLPIQPIQPSWVGFHMLGWKFLNWALGWKNPLIQLIHASYSVFGNNGCAFDKLMLASCMMIDMNLLVWYLRDIDKVNEIRTMKILLYEWTL